MKTTREYAVRYPDGHVEALYRVGYDERAPRLPQHAREAGARLVACEVSRTDWAEVEQ